MKISVVIPVYNVEPYLEQCLDSVINQTYTALEIILVDDGSTDNSGWICDEYAQKDNRIRVIHQTNAGVSVARNTGIAVASGEYISFVDSDDWLEPGMYESLCSVFKTHPDVDMLMCDYTQIFEQEKREIIQDIDGGYYSKEKIIRQIYPVLFVAEDFGKIPIVSVWNCLIKRSLLINGKILFDPELKYSEDYLFMAELVVKLNSFYYHKNHCFYNYRQLNESRSKKYRPDWWTVQMKLNRKLKAFLADNKDFDFDRALKLQVIYSGLFLANAIMRDDELSNKQKINELKKIFKYPELTAALRGFKFNNKAMVLRALLFFMKQQMAGAYWGTQKLVVLIKNQQV